METITDVELDAVTGQTVVTIVFRSGTTAITQSFTGLAWGDDDGFTGAGGGGAAGHIRIDCLTTAGATATMSTNIQIAGGQTLIMDVDAGDGIVLQLPNLSILVGTPDAMLISIEGGAMTTFGATIGTNERIGYLGFDNLSVGITTPPILCIRPH